jgi:glycosyltransferase involved in cell wall biosynthesis
LVKQGHNISAIVWNQKARNITRHVVTKGLNIYELPGINFFSTLNSSQKYPYIFGLRQAISQLRPELIDCLSPLFLTTIEAVKASKELGIPSVVTVHGVMAKRNLVTNMAQYIYLYSLGSWIFKEATLVRCLTKKDAQEIMRYGCPPEKIRIIPNGVDTELFRPENRQEENLVVWVGRFVQEKGLQYLIEAAKIVVSSLKNVKFMLIGDGPLMPKIRSMVNGYDLSNNIVFTGSVTHNQIAKTLQKATSFVLPSLKEGMPNALLESMACGKPVIGSDISGINDLVTHGQNGLLVPPRNPEALANAILTLLGSKNLRRRLGQSARQLIVREYSWDIIIKKIEKVYHEAVEQAN